MSNTVKNYGQWVLLLALIVGTVYPLPILYDSYAVLITIVFVMLTSATIISTVLYRFKLISLRKMVGRGGLSVLGYKVQPHKRVCQILTVGLLLYEGYYTIAVMCILLIVENYMYKMWLTSLTDTFNKFKHIKRMTIKDIIAGRYPQFTDVYCVGTKNEVVKLKQNYIRYGLISAKEAFATEGGMYFYKSDAEYVAKVMRGEI